MNGFAAHDKQLDPDAFGEKADGVGGALRTFDAFPKTKPTYTRRTTGGGYATLFLAVCSTLLVFLELRVYFSGEEMQSFSVEKGVSHTLQVNIDMTVKMNCKDLHVNVQDASGDRIFAGETLYRDPTAWDLWTNSRLMKLLGQERDRLASPSDAASDYDAQRRLKKEQEDTHAGHVLGEVRRGNRKFPKTPKLRRGQNADACRIYGSIEGNKVQGDFHLTARGHGYQEFGEHLSHDTFNFSHIINELSFGPLYPSILNPLDNTVASTEEHFYRFQYFLSIVPTIYTTRRTPPASLEAGLTDFTPSRSALRTNQFAVTQQAGSVAETTVPGVFFKFDIEPILLTIVAARRSLLALIVRLINVVSGVLVGGGWMYQLWGFGRDVAGRRLRRRMSQGGMLHGRKDESDRGEED